MPAAAVMNTAKPRITPAGADRFNVTHRGIKAQIWKCSRSTGHQSWRGVIVGRDSSTRRPMSGWTSEAAFRQLIEMIDEQADCAEALVQADAFDVSTGRDRIMLLGGAAAIAVFDAALVKLHRFDADGIMTVLGMIKAASSRKPIKPVTIEASLGWNKSRIYRITIVAGFSVSISVPDDESCPAPTYYIGDSAEHGSYNLHYFGTIERITAKTVTIAPRSGGTSRRLRITDFATRNARTPESKADANHRASLNI